MITTVNQCIEALWLFLWMSRIHFCDCLFKLTSKSFNHVVVDGEELDDIPSGLIFLECLDVLGYVIVTALSP